MDSQATATHFNIFYTGQIISATFPLGPDASEIFCRYEIMSGPDWELCSGLKNGITQAATSKCTRNGNNGDEVIFNMPIELAFKSTSPFGWPQIIFCLYGKTRWGNDETTLGYARTHLPLFGANPLEPIRTPILIPKCSTMLSELVHWISGKNPELKSLYILVDGMKLRGLSVESYGEILFACNTVTRGTTKLGYDWE